MIPVPAVAPAVPAAIAGLEQFPNTSIYVRPSNQAGMHDYPTRVLNHLINIYSYAIGQQLFQAITASAKRVVICYAGVNINQAAGGGTATYVKLREYHDNGNAANFGAGLQMALNSSHHDVQWLAQRCFNKPLPRWAGNNSAPPFQSPAGATVNSTVALINTWLAGNAIPDRDQMDILCLVLEQWLQPGTGTNTRIDYDPNKTHVAGMYRPPQVALFHELVHAYYNALGGQLGREDSIHEDNGGRLFELMAVGLPPFDNRHFSENRLRVFMHTPLRMTYP